MSGFVAGLVVKLVEEVEALREEKQRLHDWKEVSERSRGSMLLTPRETADFLRVDVRTVRRWAADGRIRRCPNLGGVVRYPARDVLRLASAKRKEA